MKGAMSEGLERKHGVRRKELRMIGDIGGSGVEECGRSACAKSSNMIQLASMLRTCSRQPPAAAAADDDDEGCEAIKRHKQLLTSVTRHLQGCC